MRVWILCCAAAALACGGGSSNAGAPVPGSATFVGTVRGQPVGAADATSAQIQGTSTSGQTFHEAIILLSSKPAICSQMGSGKEPKSTQFLLLALAEQDGSTVGLPKGPGVFPIVTGTPTGTTRAAAGTFLATDATCNDPIAPAGARTTSGSVTLTAAGSTYTGTFDVTLDTTDHVTGTFTAPGCPGLANVLQSSATTCQ